MVGGGGGGWVEQTALLPNRNYHNFGIKHAINFKQKQNASTCPPFTLQTITNHSIDF